MTELIDTADVRMDRGDLRVGYLRLDRFNKAAGGNDLKRAVMKGMPLRFQRSCFPQGIVPLSDYSQRFMNLFF